MNISLQQAAEIVSMTTDELMYQHQTSAIEAKINMDTMAWEFDLGDILELKGKLDEEKENELQDEESE